MSKGGARARSGPAPDPNALKRERDNQDWVTLPAEGRSGPIPKWPLGDTVENARKSLAMVQEMKEDGQKVDSALADARLALIRAEIRAARELELWQGEWKRPQAIMWAENGQELEVALYVRSFVVAERGDATTAARTLVRQQQEALGLSIPGLHRNKWRIKGGAKPAHSSSAASEAVKSSAKDRLRVVQGGK